VVVIKQWRICRATIQTYSPRRAGYLNGAFPNVFTPPLCLEIHTTTSRRDAPSMSSAASHAPRYRHRDCSWPHEGDPQGTRANTRTTAARGLQAPPRTPALVSRAWMWLKIICPNPQGHLCGTVHAPRLPRSTPPIKRAHASYISTHSPYWSACEKNQTCGCGTARLQYPSNSHNEERGVLRATYMNYLLCSRVIPR
jgi:hypothetical protein